MRLSLIVILVITILFSSTYAQDIAKMGIPIPLHESKTVEGIFNSRVIFIADQLLRNKGQIIDKPIFITTFQNLENFNEVNPLGRLISEALIHEMQIRNLRVIDFRLNEKLQITESGEIALSRDTKKIKEELKGAYILTGTYSLLKNGYFINARIIDGTSSEVISTAQALMPLNLFPVQEPPKPVKPIPSIKIVGAS